MKVKLVVILNSVPVLRELNELDTKLSLAYKLKKIVDECQGVAVAFDEKRVKLATDMGGVLNKEKSHYVFKAKTKEVEFNKAVEKLLDDDMELEIPTIHATVLERELTIAASKIQFIEWFVTGFDKLK